jgi:hypothetical protein
MYDAKIHNISSLHWHLKNKVQQMFLLFIKGREKYATQDKSIYITVRLATCRLTHIRIKKTVSWNGN